MAQPAPALWPRWTLATALGELLGFAAPAAAGPVAVRLLAGIPMPWSSLLTVLIAIVAGLFEGASLGYAQWLVLRHPLSRITRRAWVLPTTLAAGVAYLLGMTPSTLADLLPLPSWALLGIAVLLGSVLLMTIGLAQWTTLRHHVQRAGRWVGANALAWLVGLIAPFAGLALVPDGSPLAVWIIVGVLSGLVMGLTVGAITGWALVLILRDRLTVK